MNYFNLVTLISFIKPCSVTINCAFFIFFKRDAAALTELELIVLADIITVSPTFKLNSVSGIDILVTGFMVFA
jgi:hypothetical protein